MSEHTGKIAFNRAHPNTLPDHFRDIELGSFLRGQVPQDLRRQTPSASLYQLGTLESIGLAGDGKAASIVRATVVAGGVTGELTPVLYGVTPATGEIAVAPNGDIVVLAADAITSVDVLYLPDRGDSFEATLPVDPATGVCAMPANIVARGLILLTEAEVLVGGSTGKKIILVPGASPAAGRANLDVAKTQVQFAIADAVTSARVKVTVVTEKGLDAYLEGEVTTL